MARSRSDLQDILDILCSHVYFQPPSNLEMLYPAVVYEMDRADTKFADDNPYTLTKQYSMTLITQNPDDTIFEALAALPMCAHERHYVAENLNHDVFNIYF